MGATKRDVSGVFDSDIKPKQNRKTAAVDDVFQLGPRGLTFVTDKFMPEWTEVGVEMQLPLNKPAKKDKSTAVDCRGVIVECEPVGKSKKYQVSLLFLDLPQRIEAELSDKPVTAHRSAISIAK
jgi:hypothetical protein